MVQPALVLAQRQRIYTDAPEASTTLPVNDPYSTWAFAAPGARSTNTVSRVKLATLATFIRLTSSASPGRLRYSVFRTFGFCKREFYR
jgi:hypothetical protein